MRFRHYGWLVMFITIVVLFVLATSYLLLNEPNYTGPPLEEKFNQKVIVACAGSAARQDLGNIITSKNLLPKACIDKCNVNGFETGIQYSPMVADETLCLCEGESKTC